MRYWYRDKDYVYIGFNYNANFVNKMKRDFGAKYNPALKEWYFEPSLEKSLLLKYFLDGNGFKNEKPERQIEIPLKEIKPLVNEKELKEMFDYLGLPLHLRDYQIEGVSYMVNHGNCLNGCGPGVGKTRQSIALAELLNLFPCIVVCPATVKQSWVNEWKLCNPNRTVHVIDSKDETNTDWKADVTVINYDYLFKRSAKEEGKKEVKLRYSRSLTKKWGLAVIDEIHLCKNPKSIRSKCVQKIVENVEKTIGLSGTAIMNRPQELINILRILGRFKEIFPDSLYYLYRYCAAKKTRFGLVCTGASCTMELNKIIRHYCYFRKELRDVVNELPPIIKQTVNVPITNKKEYRKAEKDFIEWLANIDIEAAERAIRAEQLVRLSGLKKLSINGKIKFIVQFLKEWSEANEDEKMIVFGITTDILERLGKEFKNSEVVTGKYSTEEKMRKVETWKKEKTFLFANIASLSTGIDGLQKYCYNMSFLELPQRPAELEQATGRIDRMGQTQTMNVYFLLSSDTIDTQIRELLDGKIKVTDAVNKGIDVQVSRDDSMDIALIKKLKEWKEKK